METPEVFFLTYDEPRADARWEDLRTRLPAARRVHGVKGFDAAYKTCARSSQAPRFFTIDGDNELLPAFQELNLDYREFPEDAVLSWSARNSVNGLCYGNGGVKNWPREMAARMQTHESSQSEVAGVDFCFSLPYYQMPGTLSVAKVDETPYQAFRSGFREGVKMCLEKGRRPDVKTLGSEALRLHVWHENLDRLRIWCSVGADRENGPWAIYGARLGCKMLCLTDWDYHQIRDYDWFQSFWEEDVFPQYSLADGNWNRVRLDRDLGELEQQLNEKLDLKISLLAPEASIFFKSVYQSPPRRGLMFKPGVAANG